MPTLNTFVKALTVCVTGLLAAEAEIVKNPDLNVFSIGYTETRPWNWQKGVVADGSYDTAGIFILRGNGKGFTDCWDRGAFAHAFPYTLDSDFIFTARIRYFDTDSIGSLGIAVKSTPEARMPVLTLGWDMKWLKQYKTGTCWFNRLTPATTIGYQDNGEKGLCIGTTCHPLCPAAPKPGEVTPCYEGCLNKGYENIINGYTSPKHLWLRVWRKGTSFRLFVRTDSTAWEQIKPVSIMGTDLSDIYANESGVFTIPNATSNLVFAGLFVTGGDYGITTNTAQFDNIELRTGADASITTDAAITVFNPKRDQTIAIGSPLTVQWQTTGIKRSSVYLDLYRRGINVYSYGKAVPDSGIYQFTCPTLYDASSEGNGYSVKVTNTANSAIYGFSDTFSIVFPARPPVPIPCASPTSDRRPVLRWYRSVTNTSYEIQIDTSSVNPFASGNYYYRFKAIDTFLIPLFDLPAGVINWRVRSVGIPSTWSRISRFTINDNTVPVLIPYTPDPTTERRPTVRWHSVVNAGAYTIALARDSSFADPYTIMMTADTFFTPLVNLPFGNWFWRVKSDLAGSRYSAADQFAIVADTIPLLYTFNGVLINNRRPQLRWRPVTRAQSYQVQCSSNRFFYSPLLSIMVEDTTFQFLAGLATGSYYWRVSSSLNYYSWSAVDSFRIPSVIGLTSRAEAPARFGLTVVQGNGLSTIRFGLSQAGHAAIAIYSVDGTLVKSYSTAVNAGWHQFVWDRRSEAGTKAGRGIYLIRYAAENKTAYERLSVSE